MSRSGHGRAQLLDAENCWVEPRGNLMSDHTERRDAPRVQYEWTLHVAPYDRETFPRRDQFTEVEGRDISTTGVSYVSTEAAKPGDQLIVIARSNAVIRVTARVIHCQEIPGAPCSYVVGCVLEGRIDRHESVTAGMHDGHSATK